MMATQPKSQPKSQPKTQPKTQPKSQPKEDDPCDDEMYKGLKLSDFLRHLSAQEKTQREEIYQLNLKKFTPFRDELVEEIQKEKTMNRSQRRQILLQNRKMAKKAKKRG